MIHDRVCPTCRPGTVNFFRYGGDPAYAALLVKSTLAERVHISEHVHRLRLNSPWADLAGVLNWFPHGKAWAYRDAYAIYVGQEVAARHPEWILKDGNGNGLYIPFGTKPYVQYAGDITNPEFRAFQIEGMRDTLSRGYSGLFLDDVNYYRQVSTATGSKSGLQIGAVGPLTDLIWRREMASFMADIRHAFRGVEIAHNVIWSVNKATAETAEVGYFSADYLNIERGVNDPGIKGGTGQFALRSLLNWVDARHAQGRKVIFDSLATTDAQREYGLACYFLTSDGQDMLGSRLGGSPGDWWAGYDTVLGKPLGPRDGNLGVFFREFERGDVWVVEPGAKPYTVPGDGRVLGPASGAVILT